MEGCFGAGPNDRVPGQEFRWREIARQVPNAGVLRGGANRPDVRRAVCPRVAAYERRCHKNNMTVKRAAVEGNNKNHADRKVGNRPCNATPRSRHTRLHKTRRAGARAWLFFRSLCCGPARRAGHRGSRRSVERRNTKFTIGVAFIVSIVGRSCATDAMIGLAQAGVGTVATVARRREAARRSN